jgi:predicted RNase H-like nuclease (RuvC/YqgF family)
MKLDIVALVIGLLSIVGSLITYFAYFRVEKRKRKAEARLTEREGDIKSLDYFTTTINELVEDNKQLKADIKQLQKEVEELKEGKSDLADQLEKFKEAAKHLKDCPKYETCPMAIEYHKLINK